MQAAHDLKWEPTECGWRTQLPTEAPKFYGHPLSIDVDTRVSGDEVPLPMMSEIEIKLVNLILAEMISLVAEAEEAFKAHHHKHHWETHLSRISNPHFWISREQLAEVEADHATRDDYCPGLRWTFVVGLEGSCYGTHIEFIDRSYAET